MLDKTNRHKLDALSEKVRPDSKMEINAAMSDGKSIMDIAFGKRGQSINMTHGNETNARQTVLPSNTIGCFFGNRTLSRDNVLVGKTMPVKTKFTALLAREAEEPVGIAARAHRICQAEG